MGKVATIVVIILGLAIAYWFYSDEAEKTYISHYPAAERDGHYPAYSGDLPWNRAQPLETFNFPIKIGEVGPVTPLFAKVNPYPFYCRTQDSGLGQPLVDNQDKHGFPVYQYDQDGQRKKLLGYSKDCSLPTHIRYFYNRKGTDEFFPYTDGVSDYATVDYLGKKVPFIVKVEIGTINRYIYSIIMLHGEQAKKDNTATAYWNKKLIYYFRGGVGIGKQQGKLKLTKTLKHLKDQVEQGYAVLYSTGNQTSVHYNIPLAEDTAHRVKKQFTSQYGEPLFTMGVGGSGGAIQQYLFAQNGTDLLDGIVPLYSYPDMMTQIVYSFDCELLEYFFDVTDKDNPKWQVWENKSLVEGMSANSDVENRFGKYNKIASLFKLRWPESSQGASECTNGWRGLTPYVNNPRLSRYPDHFSSDLQASLHFTIWDDLKYIVGVDNNGYAKVAWDNTGVQYGLDAFREGLITPQEFTKINRFVGGWKPSDQLIQEKFWYFTGHYNPRNFDMHSAHNMLQSNDGNSPAERTQGDIDAITGLYRSGLVFFGKIKKPILDMRHYLEKEIDMHHMSASFSARKRIEAYEGHSEHHIIWVTEKPHTPTKEIVSLMDEWLSNLAKNGDGDIVAAKPSRAIDSCFDAQGKLLYAGNNVWHGAWNNKPAGSCMQHYPAYTNSRIVAGESWLGLSFKCQLQSIDEAYAKGLFGEVSIESIKAELEEIFPEGVCDYAKPPVGFPEEVLAVYESRRNSLLAEQTDDDNASE